MTLHVVMLTRERDGFVWITDTLAHLGLDNYNYATAQKITHLVDRKVACSIWGDTLAVRSRDELLNRVKAGAFTFDADDSKVALSLKEFGNEAFRMFGGELRPQMTSPRGILIASLETTPKVYSLSLGWPVFAVPILGQVTHGDEDNPALIFTAYYYERCRKTINELLSLGVHTVRTAEKMNSKGIRAVDAWVFEDAEFRQLTPKELAFYIELSDSLDADILTKIAASKGLTIP